MTLDLETVHTLAWCLTLLFLGHVAGVYAIVHLCLTGRGLIQRRTEHEPEGKVLWR